MQAPTIELFSTEENFQYLWLKYVTGFDLTKHCAKCLLGPYSKYFFATQVRRQMTGVPLDEAGADYYYICGVTAPYRYRDNLHIAFRFKLGAVLAYDDGKTRAIIRDAERIEIKRQAYNYPPFSGKAEYYTCRNWQFAYQMTHE